MVLGEVFAELCFCFVSREFGVPLLAAFVEEAGAINNVIREKDPVAVGDGLWRVGRKLLIAILADKELFQGGLATVVGSFHVIDVSR